MKTVLLTNFLLFLNFQSIFAININMNLNCQDPSNEDYCVLIGYNRDKLPPNPPLNISMTLAISVRICYNHQSGESYYCTKRQNLKIWASSLNGISNLPFEISWMRGWNLGSKGIHTNFLPMYTNWFRTFLQALIRFT